MRAGIAAAAVVVAAGAAAAAHWPHAGWWLTVLTAAIAAAMPFGMSALSTGVQRRTDAAKVTRQAVQGATGLKLPVVKDAANLDMRVHRAVLPIPYIHRDAEDQARSYLQDGQPVLIVGSSMVGKTRVAASLIKDMFADRTLVMPDSMAALASLESADVELRTTVIFLDDISRLIGAGGITDGTLHRLSAAPNVIVATMRAAEYDRYQPTDQFRSPEWDVLSIFERVFLDRGLSETEEDRLRAAVADHEVRQRITRTGLGEYVGAAEVIDETLRLAPSVCPVGYALVKGAADWRCAGMKTPVPASLLSALAAPHLTGADLLALSGKQTYKAALQWATREINPTVSLLRRDESGSYCIFDYALDILAQTDKSVPEIVWQILIQHAEPDDLISVGYTAEVIYHKSEIAMQAWRKAAKSGDADGAPVAACNLAVHAQHNGDLRVAQEACQRAMESGHTDHAPMAAVNLGILLQQQGDAESARAAYQRAIDSGHGDHAPRAWLGLGDLLQGDGDTEGARTAYQHAAKSRHAEVADKARQRLKELQAAHPA